ncbi:RHS repeat domain-containing protein [Bacteroides heparinolyticus]|uniref:RHS repeat domain-containing protein n=1 Tax=Prevotella heparinolytica TaxID=28113 RepID=UPI0028EB82E2|nr:DUF6443 domain-containing protein [Bacteroides heparinolyticus]
MKKLILFLLLTCGCFALCAQESTQNYINTRTMLNEAGTSHWNDISYYDGIGRPFQTVQKAVRNGVQTGAMLATLQEYDALGRKSNQWLPVPVTANYVEPSALKSATTGSNGYADSRPYSEPVYEASPLERIVQQYGPGAAWHKAGRPVKTEYLVNGSSAPLNCIHYSVNTSYALSASGVYAAGQLSVVKTTDEDGNASYAFTDKLGRLLLERRLNGKESHDTYYVYNDLGNLCFVLQPKYQEEAALGKFAFQYRYDDRNRCTWKKMPGVEHVVSVYDDADRLTFSQDGVQRAAGRWTYYKYDAFSRLTEQGECKNQNSASGTVVHLRNYYDDYSFVGSAGFRRFPKDASGHGKGLLTGSVITVLGSNEKIYVAQYYDLKGRETQRVQSNLLGGHDVTNTVYTFTGNPATVTHTHTAIKKPTRTEVYTYTYDHADRLSKVQHRLGNATVTLYEAFYDDFGRVSAKQHHGAAANKLTYAYNVRGWLTAITGAKFNQNLYYNTGAGTPSYNGNISSLTWKSGNESAVRGYKFTYDGLNRMLNAVYGETAALNANANRFSENVTGYDRNGNIRSLQRFGQTGANSYGLIDNLTFHLDGNRLSRVDDAVSASAYNHGFDFKDGAKQAGEYAYDANGNLTKDLNKKITAIQYNCLNLPSTVTFSDGGAISYTYAADGTKLRTVHKTGGAAVTTDYCGSVIYENGTQKLLLTEEGYVTLADGKYHYYLKDHQGNNRVVIDPSGTVEEVNHYYPFGGIFAGTGNVQPYKYNGKELDARKGLNWYDYGARHYDAALGRFTTVDPLAEKYYGMSLYGYCNNNPVRFIDPTGKFPIETIWDIGNVLYDIGAVIVNHIKGDHQAAKANWADLGLDAGAMLIPYVPAGTSKVLKAGATGAKALDKAADGIKTMDKAVDARKSTKIFDGGVSTNSKTSNEALRKAKDANGIPRSQQPDKTVKPNTPEGEKAGLDSRNIKQYEYTNSKGEKVTIRQDKPANYLDGGRQPAHYNAGKNKKLDQHHNY